MTREAPQRGCCDDAALVAHATRLRAGAQSVRCAHGTSFESTTIGSLLATTARGGKLFIPIPATAATPPVLCSAHQRGRIKMLQKRAGLSDAAYRAKLRELTGKSSSTTLTEAEAQTVARELDALVTP